MKNKVFVIVGSILIVLSLMMYFFGDILLERLIVNEGVNVESTDGLIDDEDIVSNDGLTPDYNEDNVESLSAMTILKYKDDMNKTIPRGRIVIDRIGVNLRIYEGLNNANLLRGACEQIPRYEMKMGDVGNYVLAAHCSRYNKHFMFSSIRYLKPGDEIKVSDNENVYVYKVTFVKKVSKEDTSFINEKVDEKLITLYTCDDVYRFYPRNRIVVRGSLDRVYKR